MPQSLLMNLCASAIRNQFILPEKFRYFGFAEVFFSIGFPILTAIKTASSGAKSAAKACNQAR
jgi:hypothetical protein